MSEIWHLENKLNLKHGFLWLKIRVSTMELDKEDYDEPYETMIFTVDGSDISLSDNFQERYKTKDEAMKQHIHLVDLLQSGFFELTPTEYKLKIKGGKVK